MTETNRPCSQCHEPTELRQLEPVSGEEKPLELTLRNLSVLVCANAHRQFVQREFAFKLLQHLTDEDEPNLPAANEKGLIFKHFLCAQCGKDLEPKPDHRHSFRVDIELAGLPTLVVELGMPVYRCSGCGKEQLHSLKEIRAHTPAALAAAFRAAEIPPG